MRSDRQYISFNVFLVCFSSQGLLLHLACFDAVILVLSLIDVTKLVLSSNLIIILLHVIWSLYLFDFICTKLGFSWNTVLFGSYCVLGSSDLPTLAYNKQWAGWDELIDLITKTYLLNFATEFWIASFLEHTLCVCMLHWAYNVGVPFGWFYNVC